MVKMRNISVKVLYVVTLLSISSKVSIVVGSVSYFSGCCFLGTHFGWRESKSSLLSLRTYADVHICSCSRYQGSFGIHIRQWAYVHLLGSQLDTITLYSY
ncbi:hypothetical protein L218DRAFT_1035956 [Marasmius fiardii PR-910]|nr:hypothetical protein L218DRAFT_1035956 [Marasmius fiardii PR-910]